MIKEKEEYFPIYNSLKTERKADIKIFIFGIRNLDFDTTYDEVDLDVYLTQNNQQITSGNKQEKLDIDKINSLEKKENYINIVRTFEFKDVTIFGDQQFQVFPFIKILFRQKRMFFDEERYLFFNTSEYCSSLSDRTKKLYRVLFEHNLGVTALDQEQKIIHEFETVVEKKDNVDEDEETISLNMHNTEEDKLLSNRNIKVEEEKEKKEKMMKDRSKRQEPNFDENGDKKFVVLMTKYKNMSVSDDITLDCLSKDKQKEKEVKKTLRKKVGNEIRELKKQNLTRPEDIQRLLNLEQEYRDLKKPQMTEPMFYGFDDITDDYDYGREIFKEDVYEYHPNLEIPYKRKNLYYIPKNPFEDKYENMDGYLKLGKECDAFIKFNTEIVFKDEEIKSETTRIEKYLDNDKDKLYTDTNSPTIKKKNKNKNNQDQEQYELEEAISNEIVRYNIFNEEYLKKMRYLFYNKEEKRKLTKQDLTVPLNNIKVRVYVYRMLKFDSTR